MAIKTMAKNTGTGQYNAGWHELTISKATDGTWNDKRTIDLNFKDYPEHMSHRVFETHNKQVVMNSQSLIYLDMLVLVLLVY